MLDQLNKVVSLLSPARLRVSRRHCPICQATRTCIRLDDNDISIRCLGCRASLVSLSIAAVITQECPDLENSDVFELSTNGPLFRFLGRHCKHLTASEYFADVTPGTRKNGVLCQDVQQLTFDDQSFDLCTSTDVFEHVPDDLAGFRSVHRVLRPGGKAIFTVPLGGETTLERARLGSNGELQHLLPPEYHGDPVSESGKILAYRTYGDDILGKLRNAGFSRSKIVRADLPPYWGLYRKVVVAQK